MVYLNSLKPGDGGGTVFRDLKQGLNPSRTTDNNQLSVIPVKGDALLFFPAFFSGKPDDRTLHKGEVALKEKMILQMWIHQGEYVPALPTNNSHEEAVVGVRLKQKDLGYL